MGYLLITRETDYALRILDALSKDERLTTSKICQKEFIPQQFGYKILKKLAKGGLIKITRGSEGGCQLCCNLKQMTLYDLIQIMQRDNWITACMQQNFLCIRRQQNKNYCQIHQNLTTIQNTLNQELQKYSLFEILKGTSSL